MENIQEELLILVEGTKDLSLIVKLRIRGCQRCKGSVSLTMIFSICSQIPKITKHQPLGQDSCGLLRHPAGNQWTSWVWQNFLQVKAQDSQLSLHAAAIVNFTWTPGRPLQHHRICQWWLTLDPCHEVPSLPSRGGTLCALPLVSTAS